MRTGLMTMLLGILVLGSCGLSHDQQQQKQKEAELKQQQQQLSAWQNQLSEKERLLEQREFRLDSTKREIDSVAIHGPSILGRWQVKMQCVETSCPGSAIGDVKTEIWEFSVNEHAITAKAYSGKTLARIYKGGYTQSGLQLSEHASGTSNMDVTMRILKEGKMDGIREIIMADCKTTYSLNANRL
ncbi:hypothetical protein [Niabella terrae]